MACEERCFWALSTPPSCSSSRHYGHNWLRGSRSVLTNHFAFDEKITKRLGKHIEKIAKALSITVLIADRKGSSVLRPGRTAFLDTLRNSTVLMVGCPLDGNTHDMIGQEELQLMKPTASLINVARGGVVNEKALVQALKDGTIACSMLE